MMQTIEELRAHLDEQLEFLRLSSKSYDSGFTGEAKRMATTIRVLVHDTPKSISLLKQLNLKNGKFFSTSIKESTLGSGQQRVGSYAGLVGVFVGRNVSSYVPYLDETPSGITGYIDFDNYWNETIFIDNKGNKFSRKDIVLSVADQDGGSHVDPILDKKYANLSRQNSMGWMSGDDQGHWVSVKGVELAAIRQIAHELLRTLVPTYPQQKKLNNNSNGFIVGGMGVVLRGSPNLKVATEADCNVPTTIKSKLRTAEGEKIGRNDSCPCGSGKKYKNCCGK